MEFPQENIGIAALASFSLVHELAAALLRKGLMSEAELADVFARAIAGHMQVRDDANVAAARMLMNLEDSMKAARESET